MPAGFSWTELGVDAARIHLVRDVPLPSSGRDFVLYWCTVNHRAERNAALDAALALGQHLKLPVVVYQGLQSDEPHASERFSAWTLDGMIDLEAALKARHIPYWLELHPSQKALVSRLGTVSQRCAALFSDFFPSFIIPEQLHQVARSVDVPLFAVDASCTVPALRIPALQIGAYTLRPKLKKLWPQYLKAPFREREGVLAKRAKRLDPPFEPALPQELRSHLSKLAVNHQVAPVPHQKGGRSAGLLHLAHFLQHGLPGYAEGRRSPSDAGQSGLSPFLHAGHLFAGEIADAALDALHVEAEDRDAFLEELLVRRELGFNYCLHTPVKAQLSLESLPAWARATLEQHRSDAREASYSFEELEQAATHDGLWNASQRELRESGRIHGYLRMLWGKKILEWSEHPQQALHTLQTLNDRYALDGRDPVSVANFMWILGLHDRPFQERPVLGKVRPMSSLRTAEKFDLGPYLDQWARPSDPAVKRKLTSKKAGARPRA